MQPVSYTPGLTLCQEARWHLMNHRLDIQAAMRQRNREMIECCRYMINYWQHTMHRAGVYEPAYREK